MRKRAPLIPIEDVHAELIENGVPAAEQKMTAEKPFWAFFTPNICITSWLFGVVAASGQGFYYTVLAIVLGNLIGSFPSALAATMGPKTRFSSLEGSRFSFGRKGVRLPAFLNWLNSVGWDAINNIPAATALAAFAALYGFHAPFWAALAVLSLIQMAIAIYGHHFFQIIAKYMGYVLIAIFILLGMRAFEAVGGIPSNAAGFSFTAFVFAFSLAAVNTAGYAAYAADYTRYLPPKTKTMSIFWKAFAGLSVSCIVMELFGAVSASLIKDQTPDSIIAGLQLLAGIFAPFILLVAGLSSIPPNAMNDNSAAYCLVSSGIHIPRPISAALAGIAGYAIAAYGAAHLSGVIENVILLLFYWVAPWTAIVLVHWFMSGMKEAKVEKTAWTAGATIFCVVTVLTIGLFSSNDLYTGPVAKSLGGADIGYYVGFFAAGILYWLALRRAAKN
jgi:NCS1 family nucleobase:cation symporter-1